MKFNIIQNSLSFIIILICIGLALSLALTDMMPRIYGAKRTFFIFFLFAYTVFRGYRVYKNIKT